MSKSPKLTKVLKKTTVRSSGQKVPVRSPHAAAEEHGPTAKAQILSVEDGVVVIQVTCGCGEEIQLRCETEALAKPPRPARAPAAAR